MRFAVHQPVAGKKSVSFKGLEVEVLLSTLPLGSADRHRKASNVSIVTTRDVFVDDISESRDTSVRTLRSE